MADELSGALRAVSFVLLLQAAGIALFIGIFSSQLLHSHDAIRRLGFWSALLGIAAVAGQFALEPARMAGELGGILDPSLQRMALHSTAGAAFGIRVLGLSLVAGGLHARAVRSRALAVIGAALAVTAFTLTGHTASHPERWLLGPLLLLHLLIVTFWIGAIPALYVASRRESTEATARLVKAFSGIAVWLIPWIFIAGVGMAMLLVPRWAVLREPYGDFLVFKVAGFGVLMLLAGLNKWRLGPAIARTSGSTLRPFRLSLATEYVLIAGVLTATAIMTLFFSPD